MKPNEAKWRCISFSSHAHEWARFAVRIEIFHHRRKLKSICIKCNKQYNQAHSAGVYKHRAQHNCIILKCLVIKDSISKTCKWELSKRSEEICCAFRQLLPPWYDLTLLTWNVTFKLHGKLDVVDNVVFSFDE